MNSHCTMYSLQFKPTQLMWCGVVCCGVVWYGVVWCGVVWCFIGHANARGVANKVCVYCLKAVNLSPHPHTPHPPPREPYRLDGLVDKASASRAEDPGFESRLRRDFSGSSHTSDSKIGFSVATLPGAWRYRVSTGTGRPGVNIL